MAVNREAGGFVNRAVRVRNAHAPQSSFSSIANRKTRLAGQSVLGSGGGGDSNLSNVKTFKWPLL